MKAEARAHSLLCRAAGNAQITLESKGVQGEYGKGDTASAPVPEEVHGSSERRRSSIHLLFSFFSWLPFV
jgi:hypothetical protein